MFFPVLVGRSCDFDETLTVSGNGVFTFDYEYPYLYVTDVGASSNSILKIYNVAVAATPVLVSTTNLPNGSGARKPRIYGTKLYIPYRASKELAIWDVSDRTAPTLLGSVSCTGCDQAGQGPTGVAVIGNTACVVYSGFLNTTSMQKIDVSNPASPSITASLKPNPPFTSSMTDVIPMSTYFLACGIFTGGASVGFVVTVDPSAFTKFDSVNITGAGGQSMAADIVATEDEHYAYTFDGAAPLLSTTDISDPTNLSVVDQLTTGGGASGNQHSLCIVDSTDRVYIGKAGGGLAIYIIDISTPNNPSQAGVMSTSGESVSCMRTVDGCAGFAWGQGTSGAAIHLLGDAPLS